MKIKFFFWINTFFSVLYLFWRIFFTIPFRAGALSVVCGIILLIFEALGMVEAFVHFTNMNTDHNYKVPDVPKERFQHTVRNRNFCIRPLMAAKIWIIPTRVRYMSICAMITEDLRWKNLPRRWE